MDSNEYSIIETFSDGSYIKSVLIDDSTDCSSLARKTSTKPDKYTLTNLLLKAIMDNYNYWYFFIYLVHHPKCTKSEISTTCPASNWKLSEKNIYIWLIS